MVKQKPNISGVASSNAQYVANSRLVNSELGFREKLSDFNSNQLQFKLSKTTETKVFIPFDGCDIRKQSTKKSEKIDKVRSLSGETVSGYHSYNTITVSENLHEISILEHKIFSTKEDDFLSKTNEILELIKSSSKIVQETNPKLQRIFIMDREFDNQRLFEDMNSRDDKFVIRCKTLDRIISSTQENRAKIHPSSSPKSSTNLNKIKFHNKFSRKIKTLKIKSKTFQDLTLKLEYQKLGILNNDRQIQEYTFIKAKLLDQNKQPIFQENKEFTIITNLPVNSNEDAYQAYLNYFIRWKIEIVFKFLKDSLGLEEFRTPKLTAIRNLMALTFLIGAYLFELGNIKVDDQFLIHLANLGDGKGQVSPFYIRQGLTKLISHIQTSCYLQQLNPPDQKQLLSFGDGIRCVGV
jgi:hypothetical protein